MQYGAYEIKIKKERYDAGQMFILFLDILSHYVSIITPGYNKIEKKKYKGFFFQMMVFNLTRYIVGVWDAKMSKVGLQ